MEPQPSYRALFAIPSMGRVLLGMVLSRTANSMLGVALLLFTLDRFGSPSLAGIVAFASAAPSLLVGPLAGALLDRHGRARLIILDQLTAATALVAIAGLTIAGVLAPWVLVLVTALAGLTTPLSGVGLRTLFPLIVPRHLWVRVNAVDSNGYVLATLVGPPVAGLLVQLIGAPQALFVIAGLYCASAAVIVGVPDPRPAAAHTEHLLVAAWQGLRYTLANPALRGLAVALSIVNVGGGIVSILVPVLLLTRFGLGEGAVGAVWAVSGLAGGISALIVGRWRIAGRERPMVVWSIAGMAAAGLAVIASPTLPVIIGFMAVQGLLNGPLDVAMFTLRQRKTDPAWLGRAFAVSMSLNFSGYPIGAALGGALVAVGTDAAMGTAIVFGLIATIGAAIMLPREDAA